MKATFQIPDELYREVKAETAREGRTVREVTISLFEQWLERKKQPGLNAAPVDWETFEPPLADLVPTGTADHGMADMRKSITNRWNEKS
jgi:hypothetical protein